MVGKPYCPGELLRRSAYCGPMPAIADLEVASEVSTADTAERNAADVLPASPRDLSPVAGVPAILDVTPAESGTSHTSTSPYHGAESSAMLGPPGLWGSLPEHRTSGASPALQDEPSVSTGPPGLWGTALDFGALDTTPISSSDASLVIGPPGVWDTSAVSLSFYAHLAEADTATILAPPTVGSQAHHLGECKPCAFVFKEGCANGVACKFCHLCDPNAKKRRKRERLLARRVPVHIP